MTFTIVARDATTGAFGIATATGSIAVGAHVPHCRFGVGAILTQGHSTNVLYGRHGMPLLARGDPAASVVSSLVEVDRGKDYRQMAVMDTRGESCCWTGSQNGDYKHHHAVQNLIVAGNLLAGPEVLEAMISAAAAAADAAPGAKLLAALAAGQAAGGDSRGTRSAALLVDDGAGAPLDLRVDYHERPIEALADLYEKASDKDYHEFLQRLPDEQNPDRY